MLPGGTVGTGKGVVGCVLGLLGLAAQAPRYGNEQGLYQEETPQAEEQAAGVAGSEPVQG